MVLYESTTNMNNDILLQYLVNIFTFLISYYVERFKSPKLSVDIFRIPTMLYRQIFLIPSNKMTFLFASKCFNFANYFLNHMAYALLWP